MPVDIIINIDFVYMDFFCWDLTSTQILNTGTPQHLILWFCGFKYLLCTVDWQIFMSSPALSLETQTYVQLPTSHLRLGMR